MAFWVNYIIRTALILEVNCPLATPAHQSPEKSKLTLDNLQDYIVERVRVGTNTATFR